MQRWKITIGIILAMACVAVAFCFFLKNASDESFYTLGAISSVVLDDQKDVDVSWTIDGGINSSRYAVIRKNKINERKNFEIILPVTKHAFAHLFDANGEREHVIVADTSYPLRFDLKQSSSDQRARFVSVDYSNQNNSVTFYIPSQNIGFNEIEIATTPIQVFSIASAAPETILKIQERTIDLGNPASISDRLPVSFFETPILEYRKSTTTNVLAGFNPSFEDGLWTGSVWDCTTEKEGNVVAMNLASEASDGNKSLELSSAPGNACTNRTFNVPLGNNRLYKLSFDYNVVVGDSARYYYRLGNEKDEKFEFSEEVFRQAQHDNSGWQRFEKILDTSQVENITMLNIHLYAPAEKGEESVVLYDNVALDEYELVNAHDVVLNVDSDVTVASGIMLNKGENVFAYKGSEESLLPRETASFERGLWKPDVWDCTTEKEKNDVFMKLSNDASEGLRSLELSSKPGNACTNYTFDAVLDSGFLYKLSFDYKTVKGSGVQYYYRLFSPQGDKEFSKRLSVEPKNEWQTFETMIDPEMVGSSKINIYLYAPAFLNQESVTRYDNVKLVKWVPKDLSSYYLYANNGSRYKSEQASKSVVEWKPINRWKNRVVMHNVGDSFLLVYPEKFSEKWKAYINESKAESQKFVKSLEGNILTCKANGWLNIFFGSNRMTTIQTDYHVPSEEVNRQASKEELRDMMNAGSISTFDGEFVSKNFDGSIRNDNLRDGWLGETWFDDSILSSLHYQVNNYSNAWWVDVNELCVKQNTCRKNPDGTWEIELVVENGYLRLWIWFIALLILGTVGAIWFWFTRYRHQTL